MIVIPGRAARAVRRAHQLSRLVVLLVAAVAGGIYLFNDLTKLVPAQLCGLSHRIHHTLQPVMFVVPEPGDAAVGFNDG